LRAELREFAYDGLVQLSADLERGVVKRGTGDGCVLSYRRGFAGSVDAARKGRRGNAFTRFWDAERMNEQHVLGLVQEEVEARRGHRRGSPGPAAADRKGRRGNAFTRFWDAERRNEQHVLRLVQEEIEARRAGVRPEPERLEPAVAG